MNVVNIKEVNNGVDSYFRIFVKNTGNNDCYDAHLLVDRHNSPLAKPGLLTKTNFLKVPKNEVVEYKIPVFQSDLSNTISNKDQRNEFEKFVNRYQNDETAVVIFFHIEYNWNEEDLKSSQYTIIKSINNKLFTSLSDEYVEPEIKIPRWKK